MLTAIVLAWCTININDARNTDNVNSTNWMHNMNWMNGMSCMNNGTWNINSMNCMQSDTNMMMHTISSEEEFIVNMMPHHQEAIDTAKVILEKSTNVKLKNLAQEIVDAQTKEIAMMQWWLQSRYPNSNVKANYENMMPDLASLSGKELDRAFLQGMIMHHMWAIHMAQSVLQINHKAETATLAENIISSQSKEIRDMQEMIKDLQ